MAQFPILYIWVTRKKINEREIAAIIPFAALISFGGLYEAIVTKQLHVDTTIWFKVYTFLEYLCINYFFLKSIDRRYHRFLWLPLMVFISVFVCLQVYWMAGGSEDTDSWLVILESVLVYGASMLWFKGSFTNMSMNSLWDSPAFYFISGFILYFSGTLFLYIMSDIVFTPEELHKYWIINIVLSLLMSITIILGIWKAHRKSSQSFG